MIYTKEEIYKLEKANAIIMEFLNSYIQKYIKIGVTTKELDDLCEEFIRARGAIPSFKGYYGFTGSACTSINEEVVHGIPKKNKKLKNGDIIGIDVGTCFEGYYGDAAKTFAVGDIREIDKKLMKVTKDSLYIGIENSKVGNTLGDIGFAIQNYVESNKFSVVREYCGHGVGKKLHEEPMVPNFGKKGKGLEIKNGMVFALEPMVNIGTWKVKVLGDNWTVVTADRKKSAHFEHSIAIINGKAKILGM